MGESSPRESELYRKALFEALLRQVPVGVSVYDVKRRFVRVNQAMCGFDGLTESQHLGRRVEEAMPGADRAIARLQQQVLDTGKSVVNILTKNVVPGAPRGSWRYWAVSFARLEAPDGRTLGLTGVIADVTERETADRRAPWGRCQAEPAQAAEDARTTPCFAGAQNAWGAVDTRLAFRHRPGPRGSGIGGDWFDVIALPGYRVAFVMGDVLGSGLPAVGIKSQLRAAVRTLARLDLSPAVVLRELDGVARALSEAHVATCIYSIYDPVAGSCAMASAGHVPPLLAVPGGPVEPLTMPVGIPLGIGAARYNEREFAVDSGSSLILYTNGLVESRHRDIDEGIDDLQRAVAKVGAATPTYPAGAPTGRTAGSGQLARPGFSDDWLERASDAAMENLAGSDAADDATVLITALDRFPEDRIAAWVLSAQPTVAAGARELVRHRLTAWAERDSEQPAAAVAAPIPTDVVELLVSELVTNALRHGRGPIGLRLLRGPRTLTCEVSDELQAAPRPRAVHHGEEGGRGLFLVDQLSTRWGVRATPHGKVIWFEL